MLYSESSIINIIITRMNCNQIEIPAESVIATLWVGVYSASNNSKTEWAYWLPNLTFESLLLNKGREYNSYVNTIYTQI